MTELRRPPQRSLPELDGEEEVDLGRYWGTLLERWWLPALGLALGIVLGYLLSLGGSEVYQARATVYLGQPLSPAGAIIQSLATNPTTVSQIVRAESTIQTVARETEVRPAELRGNISTSAVSGALNRQGQNPLVNITVNGDAPGGVSRAANALAALVVERVSAPVADKIRALRRQVAAQQAELQSIDGTIDLLRRSASRAGGLEGIILATQLNGQIQQRSQVVEQLTKTQSDLSFAENVEAGQIVNRAAPVKTTAQSRRNSVLVGGFLGLLLGIVAALLWDAVARVVRRSRM